MEETFSLISGKADVGGPPHEGAKEDQRMTNLQDKSQKSN